MSKAELETKIAELEQEALVQQAPKPKGRGVEIGFKMISQTKSGDHIYGQLYVDGWPFKAGLLPSVIKGQQIQFVEKGAIKLTGIPEGFRLEVADRVVDQQTGESRPFIGVDYL